MAVPAAYRPSRSRYQNRDRRKRLLGMMGVLLVLLFLVVNRHGAYRLYRLEKELRNLDREVVQLQERTTLLRAEKTRLQSDMAYIERLAREKYRMVKHGEKVFRVVEQKPREQPDRNR